LFISVRFNLQKSVINLRFDSIISGLNLKISGEWVLTPLTGLAKVIHSRYVTLTSLQTKKLFLKTLLIHIMTFPF